tara:strand:- start:13104 stop:13865 length:762 start_codon:yes stop_codon:yes gene_type:complete
MTKKICFIGDSLTAGKCSYDWVKNIKRFFKNNNINYEVINKANDGETSSVVRHRLKKDVIDLNPCIVVVMIGGNDIIGSVHKNAGPMYMQMFPEIQTELPSIDGYRNEMNEIVKQLDEQLPSDTKIIIMSPPPIGEGGVESEEWKIGEICNDICINSVIKRNKTDTESNRIFSVNLYQMVKDDMIRFNCNKKLELSLYTITKSRILSNFIGWKGVRYLNGFNYTTDGIHFCEEFGIICSESIIQLLYGENIIN